MLSARARGGWRVRGMGRGGATWTTRRDPHAQEERRANERNQTEKATPEWHEIKENLMNIKESLEQEVGLSPRFAEELGKVIARVSHAPREEDANAVETRLDRIEALLKSQSESPERSSSSGNSGSLWGTWASVVAGGMRQAGAPTAMFPARHTVRFQMPQAQGKTNEEMLDITDVSRLETFP